LIEPNQLDPVWVSEYAVAHRKAVQMRFGFVFALGACFVLFGSVVGTDIAAATAPAVQSATALPTIKGTVGPGMTITVSRHRAPAGRYRLVVRDKSTLHNWHILGPGVDKRTTVAGTGRTVWRVRLTTGLYRIRCDVHRSTMHTRLRIH
jgi:hypothetical protein